MKIVNEFVDLSVVRPLSCYVQNTERRKSFRFRLKRKIKHIQNENSEKTKYWTWQMENLFRYFVINSNKYMHMKHTTAHRRDIQCEWAWNCFLSNIRGIDLILQCERIIKDFHFIYDTAIYIHKNTYTRTQWSKLQVTENLKSKRKKFWWTEKFG